VNHDHLKPATAADYARVTTPERNITIKLSHEEFSILDARAHKENITRAALARNIVLEALGDPTASTDGERWSAS
jgi:hypothetical protein